MQVGPAPTTNRAQVFPVFRQKGKLCLISVIAIHPRDDPRKPTQDKLVSNSDWMVQLPIIPPALVGYENSKRGWL